MVGTTARAHRIFLDGPKTRSGLACAYDLRLLTSNRRNNRGGRCGNSAGSADEIERGPLRSKQGAGWTANHSNDLIWHHGVTVAALDLSDDASVNQVKSEERQIKPARRTGRTGHRHCRHAQPPHSFLGAQPWTDHKQSVRESGQALSR